MHWRAIVFCIDNGINAVCDGSEKSMVQYPDQNEEMMLGSVRKLYGEFGINYFTPVFDVGEVTEQYLFRLGITSKVSVRGTKDDIQIVCTQQRMFKKFVDFYILNKGWERYISDSREFFEGKIRLVEEQLKQYKKNAKSSHY
jgi:hypothetical protein